MRNACDRESSKHVNFIATKYLREGLQKGAVQQGTSFLSYVPKKLKAS